MIFAPQIFAKAGSVRSLPFLLIIGLFLQSNVNTLANEDAVFTFQEIESTCINLAHYDAKTKRLTVRFVDRDTDRFYCYSRISAEIWVTIKALNERDGGVGTYFTTTVVQHPERYPFKKIVIQEFKTIPKKKAGDSK
jgi:hypothetical protein